MTSSPGFLFLSSFAAGPPGFLSTKIVRKAITFGGFDLSFFLLGELSWDYFAALDLLAHEFDFVREGLLGGVILYKSLKLTVITMRDFQTSGSEYIP